MPESPLRAGRGRLPVPMTRLNQSLAPEVLAGGGLAGAVRPWSGPFRRYRGGDGAGGQANGAGGKGDRCAL